MSDDRKKPFNDVTEHLNKIEGHPTKKANFSQLPKPIRLLGYFFIGFALVAALLVLIGSLLYN